MKHVSPISQVSAVLCVALVFVFRNTRASVEPSLTQPLGDDEKLVVSTGCLGNCFSMPHVGYSTNCSWKCRFVNRGLANSLGTPDGIVGYPSSTHRTAPHQVLFAYWQESSSNTGGVRDPGIMKRFNYTYSYRQDGPLRRDSGAVSTFMGELFEQLGKGELPAPIPYAEKCKRQMASTMISAGGNTANHRGMVVDAMRKRGIRSSD